MQIPLTESMRTFVSQRVAAGLVALILVLALCGQRFGWLDLLNRSSLDFSGQWHAAHHGKPHPDILLIDIDDASLTQMASKVGAWPWPRSVYAYLLEGLQPYQVQSWVFDVLMTEPDLSRPDDDAYWLETLRQQQNVWLSAVLLPAGQGQTMQAAMLPKELPLQAGDPKTTVAALWPLGFQTMAARIGVINATADNDGVFRRYPLRHHLVPPLAQHSGQASNSDWQFAALPWRVASSLKTLPLQSRDDLWLTFQGPEAVPYPSISFATAFQLALNPTSNAAEIFRNKILIVGSSAVGLADLKHTAVAPQQPGMVLLATAIDNLLQDNGLHRQSDTWLWLLLGWHLLGLWLLYKTMTGFGQFCWRSGIWTLLNSSWLLLTLPLLLQHGWIFAFGPVLFWLFFSVAAFSTLAAVREYLQRQYTMRVFGRFLDPRVVATLVGQDQLGSAEKCRITVLFTDIRGFTTLSEQLDAAEVLALLNRYFSMQVATLFAHQATLDKFIGDAIMAFWGAPLSQPQQADLALQAATAMVENLQQFKLTLPANLQHFDIGIGIHTGDAVVGMLGTVQRLEYTAIGDTVNIASRLESISKSYGRVLCSEQTRQALCENFPLSPVGEVQLKGRQASIQIYRLGDA